MKVAIKEYTPTVVAIAVLVYSARHCGADTSNSVALFVMAGFWGIAWVAGVYAFHKVFRRKVAPLPTWAACKVSVDNGVASPLQEFINKYEPLEEDSASAWRDSLHAACRHCEERK